MQKYQETVISALGRPVVGAAVRVTTLAGAIATIYSDNGNTPITSLVTDATGAFGFYAADGRYTVTISGTNFPTRVISDILLEDPATGGDIAVAVGSTTRSLQTKLADSKSVLDYYQGEASYDLAFSRALAAASQVTVPDGDYGLLATLNILNDKRLVLSHGATIYAMPGFVGTRLVLIGLADASNSTNKWAIEGGTFHGKQLVDVVIESTRARYGTIRTIAIGGLKKGIWMGSSATGSKGDCNILPGTEVWWWDNGTAAPLANTSDSIGIHYDKCPDSQLFSPSVVGYRTGIQVDAGSCRVIVPHVWTDTSKNHGPMSCGIRVNGNLNSFVSPYLDTPTNVGDGTITNVYGMEIGGFCNTIADFQIYINGNFNAVDNLATAINFTVANSQTRVLGFTSQTTSTSFKLKAYFSGFWTTADKVTITGMAEDARVYDTTQRFIQFGDRPVHLDTATQFGADATFFGQGIFSGNLKKTGAAGTNRFTNYQTAGSDRLTVGINATAESGSNVGSEFVVQLYDDAGAYSGQPFNAKRTAPGRGIVGDPGLTGTRVEMNTDSTTTAPSAGGAGALPATPTGYAIVRINGVDRKVPYY